MNRPAPHPGSPGPSAPFANRITVPEIRAARESGRRIVMLTAYDYPTARILDTAGVDVLLVGDSLGNNVLGYESTLPVTMEEMLHHTRAVARAARRALVVGDMPYLSFQTGKRDAVRNAGRFLKEGGAAAVKIEGGRKRAGLVEALLDAEIPVMGHIGLTPQSVHLMGGEIAAAVRRCSDDVRNGAFPSEAEVYSAPEAVGSAKPGRP